MNPWKELFALAAARGGVVAIADADAIEGLSRAMVMRRATREGWTRLHPGVYLLPGVPDGARTRLVAGTLAVDGYAARRSALWLHGAAERVPVRPQLVVPHRRRGVVGRAVDQHRSRRLPDGHVTEVDGIPTTTAERAVVDLAAGGEHPRRLTSLVVEGEGRRRLSRARLADVRADLPPGFPGLSTVDRVLADLGALRSDSGWEHEVRSDLARLGFPVHPEPFPYRCEDGVVVHLDVAFPDHWVYGECDGRAFHDGAEAFEVDRVRWTQVVRRWRPVWITWSRWSYERRAVLQDLERALELADPSVAPARPA